MVMITESPHALMDGLNATSRILITCEACNQRPVPDAEEEIDAMVAHAQLQR